MHTDGEAYERFMGRWSRRLAPVFLDFVGVQDGQSVLDVGSGTGSVAGAVLSTSQTIRVMGIDASADYIARAGERLQSERVTFEQGDAQRLRFPAHRSTGLSPYLCSTSSRMQPQHFTR